LIIPMIIQTIGLDPSGAVWTDEASNVSRPDPSGAIQIDAEHSTRNRKVEGSTSLTVDAAIPSQLPGRSKAGSRCRRQHHPTGSTGAHNQGGNNIDSISQSRGLRAWGAKAAFAAGGVLVGGVLVGTLTANAADTTDTADQAGAYGTQAGPRSGGHADESKSQRPDEELLSGDTASKVQAAALAKYPGATVLRVETDSDGVYEAHLETTDGQRVTVEIDKAFKVTGEESGRRP
jgi:hypothetical protein